MTRALAHLALLALLAALGLGVLSTSAPHAAAEPAATPPTNDVGPVDWGDPSPTPTIHAPSGFGRTYLRVPATQAARDWAWRKLGTRQWLCLDAIGHHESGWRVKAGSPDGSYGIFQARPSSKYAKYAKPGEDWRTDAMPQVRFGIAYATARYGSPCGAWTFWRRHGWW